MATSQREEKEEMCPRGTDIGVMRPQVKEMPGGLKKLEEARKFSLLETGNMVLLTR